MSGCRHLTQGVPAGRRLARLRKGHAHALQGRQLRARPHAGGSAHRDALDQLHHLGPDGGLVCEVEQVEEQEPLVRAVRHLPHVPAHVSPLDVRPRAEDAPVQRLRISSGTSARYRGPLSIEEPRGEPERAFGKAADTSTSTKASPSTIRFRTELCRTLMDPASQKGISRSITSSILVRRVGGVAGTYIYMIARGANGYGVVQNSGRRRLL